MVEVPDIHFKSCGDLLKPDVGNQYRYSSEVTQQITFSAASFRLEHPDHLRDDTGAYIAGVEGALRAYESLLKSTPDAKLAFLDELLAKRARGDLGDRVAKLANEKCKKPNTALILNSAGAGVGLVLSLIVARWFGRPRVPPRSRPGNGTSGYASARIATNTQRVVLVCAAYVVIVLAILHILEPEFDPRFRFMSEYALGITDGS